MPNLNKPMGQLKNFLLNENRNYLGKQIGDILTSLQDIEEDAENLGMRHLARLVDKEIDNMRAILKDNWSEEEMREFLPVIQKVAVYLKKTIEDKGDMREALPAALQELQNLSGKLGVKVNKLKGVPEGGDDQIADFELTGPDPNAANQPPQANGMQAAGGGMGGGAPPIGGGGGGAPPIAGG